MRWILFDISDIFRTHAPSGYSADQEGYANMKFLKHLTHLLRLKKILYACAALVVFFTAYSLILPAITMEKKTYCGIEEHTHSDDCYEVTKKCVCGQEEYEGHTHTDKCYREEKVLICENKDEDHEHTDECYGTESVLDCGKQETPGHKHTDGCYEVEKKLICGKEEHVHSAECFVDPDAETEADNNAADNEDSGEDLKETEGTTADPGDDNTSDSDEENISDPAEDSTPEDPAMTSAEDSTEENSTEENSDEDTSETETETETETDETETMTEPDPELTYPEMVLSEKIKKNLLETWIEIAVYAPEGALPEGSKLQLEQYELGKGYQETFEDALDHALEGGLLEYKAVKISFIDAAGMPVVPLREVQVYIKDSIVKDAEKLELVQIDDEEKNDLKTILLTIDEEENENTEEDVVTYQSWPNDPAVLAIASTTLEKTLTAEGDDYTITVGCGAKACVPAGASLKVKEILQNSRDYDGYVSDAEKTLDVEEGNISYARFFDITIVDQDGNEIQPKEAVDVKIELADLQENIEENDEAEPQVLHFGEGDEPEMVGSELDGDEVSFAAEGFSVYGVVYTVDFHWEVDGQEYEFNLAGGGTASFRDLAVILHLVSEDELDAFIEDINTIEFSDESLVQVTPITENITAGELKEALGVESEYSAELSDKQIEYLNGKVFKAHDWALISLKAFESEEYLTVWMKDGESFRILVTDAQLRKNVLTSSGSTYVVTVTYGDDAMIPEDAELRVREIAEDEDAYSEVRQDIMDGLAENLEEIPSHPVLFDISIWSGDQEIEPAEGSEVLVEVKFVGDAVKGMYTDEDSPLLINDMHIRDDQAEMEKQLQVIHLTDDEGMETMDTEDAITPEEIASSFTTDSFSNWLLYLDETVTSIGVTTSDSVTLRPYTSWVWKHRDEPTEPIDYTDGEWTFPTDTWDTWTSNEGGVNYRFYRHKTNGSVFRSFSKTDSQLNETYTVVTSDSLSATNGGFDLTTNKGKTIHVNVTQGDSSDKPKTVAGVSGLTVNLFDYDVPYQNNTYDFTKSGPLDVQSNVASNPNSNNNINTGKYLKFLGYGGGNAGSNSTYYYGGINNYTQDDPKQGIVQNTLAANGFPTLVYGDHQNLGYLFDTSSKDHNVYAFPEADGLFQRDNQGYYYYNSNVNYAEFDRANNQFILYEHTYSQNTGGSNGANAKPIGFFPFHKFDTVDTQPSMNFNGNLNHHFGMSMEVDFEIPGGNRQAVGPDGDPHDIIYEFSGDDDLWVFVDDQLVLDIGGIHQPVTGTINFTTGVIKVHGVADKTMTFDVGSHTLKMFYIERGGCDSNLSVRFNLPLIVGKGDVGLVKKSMVTDPVADTALPFAVFGIWDNPECSGDPYTVATSDLEGIIFKNLPVRQVPQMYYMREMIPPEGYTLDRTIFTLTANGAKDPDGDYIFTVSSNGTQLSDDGVLGYPIIRNKAVVPIQLTVKKQWQNADGTEQTPTHETATFAVKRTKTYSTVPVYTVTLRTDANNNKVFDTITAHEGDVLTIAYTHSADSNNYSQTCYAENGQFAVSLPTSGTVQQTTATYTVNGNHANSGTSNIVIVIPWESFAKWCNPESNSSYAFPHFEGIQTAAYEMTTEDDTAFNNAGHKIIVNLAESWEAASEEFPAQETISGITYHYEYSVVEENVPEGYEVIYLDASGNPTTGSGSPSTSVGGQIGVINREFLDVPVEKHWGDFSGTMYTWTATFQLEQMEEKVDPNAENAPDAIADFEAIPGKVMTIQKGQTPAPKFTDLPMYRVHDNGTVYRILYSVDEIGYTVERIGSNGSTIVVQWGKDANGNTLEIIGDKRFEAQFDQDAGENGSGIDDYIIKVANVLKDYHLSKEIDLSVLKTWPDGSDYASDPDAYASFVLKRTVHQEYRDYSNTDIDTHWVTITLQTWQNNTSAIQTATVPEGTTVHILGSILPKTNANYIAFSQSSGQEPLTLVSDNSNSSQALPFDITVVADQDKTISLTRGDNFVVGGRDGFRLADYRNRNQDRPDVEFGELLPDGSHGIPFTLNMANQWGAVFPDQPVLVEQKIDPTTGAQTIYVYSYYIEETDCSPKDFYPVFRDGSGAMVGDVNSPIEYTTQLTAENVRKTIDVTLKKVSTDHLDDATEPPTLTGASFQLEKYTAKTFRAMDTTWGNNGVMFLSDDDEDGIFTFEGLSTGYYKVVEVSVPGGYVKLSEDPTFEVRLNANGELEVILLNSDGTDADNNQTDMLRVNELIIRYGNPPGTALPNAGGPGTHLYTILGSILILGAGVLLWRRRRLI